MLRSKIYILFFTMLLPCTGFTEIQLPEGNSPEPVVFPHFPTTMHTFIWRNWPIVDVERLAKVLETSPDNIRTVAESMGLSAQHPVPPQNQKRIYISLIRRNWHLLPNKQLLTLLDFTPEQLALSLKEDDFLFAKLGMLKPKCQPLIYHKPKDEENQRCQEIKGIIDSYFADDLKSPAEEPFQFFSSLNQVQPNKTTEISKEKSRFSLRYIYSYASMFGDPLLTSDPDSCSDGLMQKLSAIGVDGIWIHTVLNQLAPSAIFPEFGKGSDIRLKNLTELVKRARKYNIGIYLYMNEPRSMPAGFFAGREDMKGVEENQNFALCTSNPLVRKWIVESLAHVFKNVPDLAGVFTITASENLTTCASHYTSDKCPRCSKRQESEIILEVNKAIEEGVHQGNPKAKVITWDWGWKDTWGKEIIPKLPKSVWLMSVSEWSKPIERGGIKTEVGEYSISAVGPGPRALGQWKLAKEAGLKTIAKMQINNSWEISAVPYLPVLDLIAEHCQNLLKQDVNGLMLSWSLGGYPSPNLALIEQFDRPTPPTKEQALDAMAKTMYGEKAAPIARKAWTNFSQAFQEYPYNSNVLYRCPVQYGPSNLLYSKPTGYAATMVGLPYDDVNGWVSPYSADVFAEQFSKMAKGWSNGMIELQKAQELVPSDKKQAAEEQKRFAEAAGLHFSTVANQVNFTVLRNSLLKKDQQITPEEHQKKIAAMKKILQSEIDIAHQLFILARQDSRIGFEASNHYYYVPVDLMEKVINCRYILDRIESLYP